MQMNPETAARQFLTTGSIVSIMPHGSGHIHDTYLVRTVGGEHDYILQRINHDIFKDIQGMMLNIRHVTEHLRKKLSSMPGHDPFRETLNLVRTKDQEDYYRDTEGGYWRMFVFIPGMKVYEAADTPRVAGEAGRIIGLFHRLLEDIRTPLTETLPAFHSIRRREKEFSVALRQGGSDRAGSAGEEIRFAEDRLDVMREFFDAFERMALPRRTVHYDTKLNNILFDEQDRAACLIDLDTLCPGYVHFDYGDALRTLANTAAEDEKNLSRVTFNVPFYRSFTEGYLSEARQFLSEQELDMLLFSPVYLTFLIGLRFLTDYLNGDIYFKTKYAEHNLVRARVQFKLVREMSVELRA